MIDLMAHSVFRVDAHRYKRTTALLRAQVWHVNHKRVARIHDGKVFGMLSLIDEYSRACLAIKVQRLLLLLNKENALHPNQ